MDPGDELAHRHEARPDWFEAWDFAFCTRDARFGGHATLLRWPVLGRAWYWAAVVREDEPTVAMLATDIALGRQRSMELRGSGVWADQNCETPFEHWSYGLEAFAIRLDHPDDALIDFRGERVALGYDLEWESDAEIVPTAGGYTQGGRALGEVLVGDERIDLEDGTGLRSHVWGVGMPPLRPGARFRGARSWRDGVPDQVVGASIARLGRPLGLLARRLLVRARDGASGWANLLDDDAQ